MSRTNHKICRHFIYRLYWTSRVSRDALGHYGVLFRSKLLRRPLCVLGIGGFIGVAAGFKGSIGTGILITLLFSVMAASIFSIGEPSNDVAAVKNISSASRDPVLEKKRQLPDWLLIGCFIAIMIYGFVYTSVPRHLAESYIRSQNDEGDYDRTYSGYIIDAPLSASDDSYHSYVLETDEGFKMSFFSSLQDLEYGDYAKIDGRISEHRGAENPGGFDYQEYYNNKGIYIKLLTSDRKIIISEERFRRPGLIRQISAAFSGFREQIILSWKKFMPADDANILGAMILGDKSGLSHEMRNVFRAANLSHIIAVSGLHVSCFLIPVLFCGRLSGKRYMRRSVTVIALLLFGFIAGWTPSVTRAVIMCNYGIVSSALNQRTDNLSGLFISSVILLFVNPYYICDVGYRLSFVSTLSIVLLAMLITYKLKTRMPRTVSEPIAVMLSAQVGMIPIITAMSAKQSPVLMLSSLIGTILSQWICIITIPVTAFDFIFTEWTAGRINSSILYYPVRGLIDILRRAAEYAAYDSVDAIRLQTVAPMLLASLIGLFIFISVKPSLIKKSIAVITSLLFIFGFATQVGQYYERPLVTIVFLDVGQGDSALIISGDKAILIDAGEAGQGERVLVPALDHYGIRRPDIALLTHLHSDHAGGLAELFEEDRIGEIGTPFFGYGEEYSHLIEGFPEAEQLFYPLRAGDTVELDDHVRMDVIHPFEPEFEGGNEDSMVVLLTAYGTGVLFMGDAGFPTEERLMTDDEIRSFLSENTDIIKVGHHGSKYASSELFLFALLPKAAVISVGTNFYGHPTGEAIHRIEQSGADLYRTDLGGAIIVEIFEDRIGIRTMLRQGDTSDNKG